jgi:hypothetical protein
LGDLSNDIARTISPSPEFPTPAPLIFIVEVRTTDNRCVLRTNKSSQSHFRESLLVFLSKHGVRVRIIPRVTFGIEARFVSSTCPVSSLFEELSPPNVIIGPKYRTCQLDKSRFEMLGQLREGVQTPFRQSGARTACWTEAHSCNRSFVSGYIYDRMGAFRIDSPVFSSSFRCAEVYSLAVMM